MKIYNVSFRFRTNANPEDYTIFGIIRDKDEKVVINLGAPGDEFPCIMLEYNKIKNEFFLSKLRAQKFGGWKTDDRTICTFPPLPTSGALDILVGLSLEICKKYVGEVPTYLNDGAMTNDRYPLTWLKFFSTESRRATTYSKYGFISRAKPKGHIGSDTQKTFQQTLKNVDMYFKKHPNKKRYMLNMFEKRNVSLYDPEFQDKELKRIDLRGKWYMDWASYKPLIKIIETSLSGTNSAGV
jgi:hypothetical protein